MTPWINKAQFDANDASAVDTPGQHAYATTGKGQVKVYRYMQMMDGVTYAAGHSLTLASGDSDGSSGAPSGTVSGKDIPYTTATNDRSGGSHRANHPFAGLAGAVYTQNYYGWLQFRGYADTIFTDGGITEGCHIKVKVGTDAEATLEATTYATSSLLTFMGHAEAADSSTNAEGMLCGLNFM